MCRCVCFVRPQLFEEKYLFTFVIKLNESIGDMRNYFICNTVRIRTFLLFKRNMYFPKSVYKIFMSTTHIRNVKYRKRAQNRRKSQNVAEKGRSSNRVGKAVGVDIQYVHMAAFLLPQKCAVYNITFYVELKRIGWQKE